jgi:S1-C subfamily serine protease
MAGVLVGLAGCVSSPPSATSPSTSIAPLPTAVTLVHQPPTTTANLATTLLDEARDWAYRVRSTTCLATGSSFALDGEVVTNRHVASGSSSLQLSTWDGTDFTASVSSISSGPDLAILHGTAIPTRASAHLAGSDPSPGTLGGAAGYPEGDQLSLIPGSVLAYVNGPVVGSYGRVMVISNAVQPGNSGSALIDAFGSVVGVVFARGNSLGYAVPVSELHGFLTAPGASVVGRCLG